MDSYIVNLKEKGRGFALCSVLCALSYPPLPGPFSKKKGGVTAKKNVLTGLSPGS